MPSGNDLVSVSVPNAGQCHQLFLRRGIQVDQFVLRSRSALSFLAGAGCFPSLDFVAGVCATLRAQAITSCPTQRLSVPRSPLEFEVCLWDSWLMFHNTYLRAFSTLYYLNLVFIRFLGRLLQSRSTL